MSANSVLPPSGGILRADRSEYFAGTSLKELSECQSWLPSPNRRRRSSRGSTSLFLSRLEMSPSSMPRRRSWRAAMSPVAVSSGPSWRLKASCWSSVSCWSWNTSTPKRFMPAWMAATSASVRVRVRSMPDTTPAKKSRLTGSIGWMEAVMVDGSLARRRRGVRPLLGQRRPFAEQPAIVLVEMLVQHARALDPLDPEIPIVGSQFAPSADQGHVDIVGHGDRPDRAVGAPALFVGIDDVELAAVTDRPAQPRKVDPFGAGGDTGRDEHLLVCERHPHGLGQHHRHL